jgi:hypothetical protein
MELYTAESGKTVKDQQDVQPVWVWLGAMTCQCREEQGSTERRAGAREARTCELILLSAQPTVQLQVAGTTPRTHHSFPPLPCAQTTDKQTSA